MLRYAFTVQSGGVPLQSAMLSLATAPVPEPASALMDMAWQAMQARWMARWHGPLLPR